MDLIDYVDLEKMKAAMEKMGADLPSNFVDHLDTHLRVFVARYQYRKTTAKWPHKNMRTVPRILRGFFSKPIFHSTSHFISYDEDFIRGWTETLMDRPKRVEKVISDATVVKDIQTIFEGMRRPEQYNKQIEVRQILDVIPRTKSRRSGQYAFVKIDLLTGRITYSPSTPTLNHVGYLPSFYGHDHIRVFMPTPNARVAATIVDGRLLLFNEKFFLFVRK